MKSRILILFLVLIAMWSGMLIRAAYVQILPNQRLSDLQKRQFETTVEMRARRGAIFDRNGKELAITIPAYSLFADPELIEGKKWLSKKLSKILRMNSGEIFKKLKSEKRFVWIKRHVSPTEMEEVKKWNVRGLGFIEEPKRVYPNDHLLAQTLGFVGIEGKGLEGLEMWYDERLKGESRRVLLPRDARGRPLLANGRVLTDVPDGSDVTLTIDSELQFMLESELKSAVEAHQASSAVGLVLDAQTSEILAMGHAPTFNINQAAQFPQEVKRNRSVTDAFEPGSTLKTFVIASALQDGLIKPSSKFFCENGKMKVGDKWISEADTKHHFGWLTASEILAYSSNIGVSKIASEMGAEKLREHLLNFGFGQRSGVDLPGESRGIVQALPWRPHLLANISFGHGITATPLQIAAGYAAIANGGVLRKPYIVKTIQTLDDEEPLHFESQDMRRVLQPAQAATMAMMLSNATTGQGTGVNAQIVGYPVAGKTGTAQKVDAEKGGYNEGVYISSFAGFVPASNPRFVIYIAVDHPRKDYYGSQVAAPVFARMAQYAVRRAGLPPLLIKQENVLARRQEKKESFKDQQVQAMNTLQGQMPDLLGLSLREAYQRLHGQPVQVEIRGSGVVSRTDPAAGEEMNDAKRVRIWLESTL